jgi:uncharacterized membrane protein YedE/YeeE
MPMMLTGLICGFIFGWGLLVSQMVNPLKVLNFLDVLAIPSGGWDPSLIVVMGVALVVAGIGFALAGKRGRPVFAPKYEWSTAAGIDRDLVVGSALFGLGWGMVGLCPGPALENLVALSPQIVVFIVAMAAGMLLHRLWLRRPTMPQILAPLGDG